MVLKALKKLYDALGKLIDFIGIVAAGLMFILLAYQIFMRFLTTKGDVKANEMVTYLFIWLIYIGMVVAAKNHSHMRVTMLADAFKPRIRNTIYLISNLLWLYYCGYVVIVTIQLIQQFQALNSKTTVLQIPIWVTYLILPITFTWSSMYIIRDIIDNIKGIIKPDRNTLTSGGNVT